MGRVLVGVAVVLGVGVIALAVFGDAYRLPSENMKPTFEVGDRVLTLPAGDAEVGDVIVHRAPAIAESGSGDCAEPPPEGAMCARPDQEAGEVKFIKRVVARGGDRIALRDGRVIRNGRPADEPYAADCGRAEACDFPREITVPPGHLYVLGDNRGASDDSRFWGPISESWVAGRVVARYWPPSRAGGV